MIYVILVTSALFIYRRPLVQKSHERLNKREIKGKLPLQKERQESSNVFKRESNLRRDGKKKRLIIML